MPELKGLNLKKQGEKGFISFVNKLSKKIHTGVLFMFLLFGRFEERKKKKQDPSEFVQIESLCLTNGGNHLHLTSAQLCKLIIHHTFNVPRTPVQKYTYCISSGFLKG